MSRASAAENDRLARARAAVETVVDPEIPVLTIADLGILRDISACDDGIEVAITPTYSGCPAMNTIALDIEVALHTAGFEQVRVKTVLSPAWTTDWLTDEGRAKLAGVWHRATRPGRNTSRAFRCGQSCVSALWLDAYDAIGGVRLDLVQSAVALRHLSRAVRLFPVPLGRGYPEISHVARA